VAVSAKKISIFWFRRDLRLDDNHGLDQALRGGHPVLPLFIFDTRILASLPDRHDRRVQFIQNALERLHKALKEKGSGLAVCRGEPGTVWPRILGRHRVAAVYCNRDYEPYAVGRDEAVRRLLEKRGIPFHTFKDHVIFEGDDILKADGTPYTVFTPYRNAWRKRFVREMPAPFPSGRWGHRFVAADNIRSPMGVKVGHHVGKTGFPGRSLPRKVIENYHLSRDFPGIRSTTRLGVHLRFGTLSIRRAAGWGFRLNRVWLDELIWRDFFAMILRRFPRVADGPFKQDYRQFRWRESPGDFDRWCTGHTGFPMVDAGMRELNATGFMHNRSRMITANFLSKLLLIDWRSGERYFADRLLDFELASNNGNWQWAAGTGCDAAPFFRIFNPEIQQKRFDPKFAYIRRWIPEYGSPRYPDPMVDYRNARARALNHYRIEKSLLHSP